MQRNLRERNEKKKTQNCQNPEANIITHVHTHTHTHKHTQTRARAHHTHTPTDVSVETTRFFPIENSLFAKYFGFIKQKKEKKKEKKKKITTTSAENPRLKGSPFEAWRRSVYSRACYAYCHGFLPYFLPFRSIYLHFLFSPKPLPNFSCVNYG